MKTPHLIGLGGKLRAGKDAVGDYLEATHGYVKLGMSDALNEALLKLNPIIPTGKYWESGYEHYMTYQDYHAAHGYVEAKKNPEVRRLLQVLGTEVGREMISEDVWVSIAEKKIREHWAEGKQVVITAMRFPNEIEMLNRLGGLSLWIDRPDELRSEGLESSLGTPITPVGFKERTEANRGISEHASENSVNADMFYQTIVNDSSLDELYQKIETAIDREYVPQGWATYGFGPSASEALSMSFHPPYDR